MVKLLPYLVEVGEQGQRQVVEIIPRCVIGRTVVDAGWFAVGFSGGPKGMISLFISYLQFYSFWGIPWRWGSNYGTVTWLPQLAMSFLFDLQDHCLGWTSSARLSHMQRVLSFLGVPRDPQDEYLLRILELKSHPRCPPEADETLVQGPEHPQFGMSFMIPRTISLAKHLQPYWATPGPWSHSKNRDLSFLWFCLLAGSPQ